MNLELIVPFLIETAKQLCDSIVKGENVGTDGIKGIQSAYVLAKIWAESVVKSTVTTIDDNTLKAFFVLCEDTASEGNFVLPVLE